MIIICQVKKNLLNLIFIFKFLFGLSLKTLSLGSVFSFVNPSKIRQT